MMLWTAVVAWLTSVSGGRECLIFSSKVHGLLSPALSLLLVFKTNTAYNRFWEGRKVWEKLSNLSRNYIRQVSLYNGHSGGPPSIRRSALHLSAFPYALAEHLTTNHRHATQLGAYLSPSEARRVESSFNKPLAVLALMTKHVRRIPECPDPARQDHLRSTPFSSRDRLSLLKVIEDMTKCVGACERLVATPVPSSYGRHTARFLGTYCLTLPLAVVSDLGFLAVPAVGLLTWVLYGVQEIGVMIENPFGEGALDLAELSDHMACDALAMAKEEVEISEELAHPHHPHHHLEGRSR
jgi:putative membrane protein